MHICSTLLIIAGVLHEVLFEDTHEYGGQEASQQQNCHTRVDDAEPVDLQDRQTFLLSHNIQETNCQCMTIMLAESACQAINIYVGLCWVKEHAK